MADIFSYIVGAKTDKIKELLSEDPSLVEILNPHRPANDLEIPLKYTYTYMKQCRDEYQDKPDGSPSKKRIMAKIHRWETEIIPLLHDASLKYAIDHNVNHIFTVFFRLGMKAEYERFQTGELKGTTALEYADKYNPAVAKEIREEIQRDNEHAESMKEFDQISAECDRQEQELRQKQAKLDRDYAKAQAELVAKQAAHIQAALGKIDQIEKQQAKPSKVTPAFFNASAAQNNEENKKDEQPDTGCGCSIQ